MEAVLEVYERSYDPQQPVVCLNEKPITLHAGLRPASPAAPGREARRDNEYELCGTANVFCAVEPKAGRHFTFATPDRSGSEFAQVAVTLALAYPEAKTIHLVMDNLNIHRRKALADVFGPEMAAEVWDRFTVHYTPTHGSWLNQAEIEIGIFSRQCLGSRRIPNLKALRREARAGNRRMNHDRIQINWKFGRRAARRKFGYKRKRFTRSQTQRTRVQRVAVDDDCRSAWRALDSRSPAPRAPPSGGMAILFAPVNRHLYVGCVAPRSWRREYPRRSRPRRVLCGVELRYVLSLGSPVFLRSIGCTWLETEVGAWRRCANSSHLRVLESSVSRFNQIR
jgi:hypothetical protein